MAAQQRPGKKYDGYRSFQYLEENVDYQPFKLAKEVDRVASNKVAVTEEQEAHVQRLLEENLVTSRPDPAFVVRDAPFQIVGHRRAGGDCPAYEGLRVSGLD